MHSFNSSDQLLNITTSIKMHHMVETDFFFLSLHAMFPRMEWHEVDQFWNQIIACVSKAPNPVVRKNWPGSFIMAGGGVEHGEILLQPSLYFPLFLCSVFLRIF